MKHVERERDMLRAALRRVQAEARWEKQGPPDGIGRGPEKMRALLSIDRIATDALSADAAGETTSLAEALDKLDVERRRAESRATYVNLIKVALEENRPGDVPELLGYLL